MKMDVRNMKIVPCIPALSAALYLLPAWAATAVLQNEHIAASIELDTLSKRFGSVIGFAGRGSIGTPAHTTWFRLRAGDRTASNRSVIVNSADTVCVELSRFGSYPLTARIMYTLAGNALVMEFACWSASRVELAGGLLFDMKSDYPELSYSSQNHESGYYRIASAGNVQVHCNTKLHFYDADNAAVFYMRNPFHSFWELNTTDRGGHILWILQPVMPRGRYKYRQLEGPAFAPVLAENDTLYRRVEVYCSDSIAFPLCLSEHPDGFSRTLTMYWDELPNRDNWAFMTTADARDVKYDHYFVRLLTEHPSLKMGYLLLCDRLLYVHNTVFDSWIVDTAFIVADSLEEAQGQWCACMIAQERTTLRMYQDVACSPSAHYTLSYMMKTENIRGAGAYGEVYGSSNNLLAADAAQAASTDWRRCSLPVSTGATDSTMRVFLRIENSSGIALFDDVSLVKNGATVNLLANGGFESNTPWITYDNVRRHWSDAHGPDHVASRAPQAYLDFLRRIENDEMMYGWENRVRLGSHGYHHTPSLFHPEPEHEFQHYDPEGDALRVHRIFSETRAMGRTPKSLRFWRTPGHKYTASLLNILLDSGVVFFDPGETTFPSDRRLYTCSLLHKGDKRLCGVNCSYWADVATNDSDDDLCAMLGRGHLGHIGAHPDELFLGAMEESYNRFNRVITKCEQSYPNLGYVFPDEFADNAIAIYNLRVTGVSSSGPDVHMALSGSVRQGNSAVFVGSCDQALFDGAAAATRTEGPRTYIILPDAPQGAHTLVLKNAQAAPIRHGAARVSRRGETIVFDMMRREVRLEADALWPARLEIFDMRGRRVFAAARRLRIDDASSVISFRKACLSDGLYVFRLLSGNECMIAHSYIISDRHAVR